MYGCERSGEGEERQKTEVGEKRILEQLVVSPSLLFLLRENWERVVTGLPVS